MSELLSFEFHCRDIAEFCCAASLKMVRYVATLGLFYSGKSTESLIWIPGKCEQMVNIPVIVQVLKLLPDLTSTEM